ncbi:putative Cystatin domain-containing protein [Medicago truncatula]|uniref:Cysteine protease inhibitor cystatin n=2 Tax=Medicago truncatula TaxID=3880 RepID=A0A072TSY5_MEDTR|nr:cysteine proteinase inhibitor B [Medicago truncatula]KEH20629.1 cysteine protease inhibitor cystatin [Medicago truncatula]RHN42519.1 putative Cystatin domain-containing protein [Medicago truncatula]
MAAPLIIRSPATLTMTLMAAWLVLCSTASRMVGGKTEVANVRTNDEVQELGRFAVEEYNRSVKIWKEGEGELRFVEVVEAQQQVVSGIKYYMKIWVTQAKSDGVGDPTMFDSVVLVKPWLNSKHLLHFAPSPQ